MTKSALLVMDVQRDVVELADDGSGYLPRLRTAIDAARTSAVPVIYVVMALRPDVPDAAHPTRIIRTVEEAGLFTEGTRGSEIHPAVAPLPGETVVTKRRAGAFSGNDMDLVLRTHDVNRLILTGIATSGVVLHTACHANDTDIPFTVLSDACLDLDPEVHRTLTERLFPQWAEVTTTASWAQSITR
ncbi:isochorismatase [Streptomyces venezuelae]|uniref:Isochorismatase n=1 Tax=Streptomyces venezuelae TaxID=54571 RepID=A0A5P2CM28_STRVZ|nr:cysteine hydrolase [Streptomyces venezuelae]QES43463.1 isochorismatase [Streptomyces venezuelae]